MIITTRALLDSHLADADQRRERADAVTAEVLARWADDDAAAGTRPKSGRRLFRRAAVAA